MPLLKYVLPTQEKNIMWEIHKGTCGHHARGQSFVFKALRQGYNWPTMNADCMEYAQECDKCQRFSSVSKAHPEELISLTSPWSFTVWGIDLIGRLPKGRGSGQYTVVAINYFTKQVEAEALTSIIPAKIREFVYKNIVYRYRVPHTIVLDNDTQFNCEEFKEFCDYLQIKNVFTSVARPQANGQVEAVNKTIKHNLKTKLKDQKGRWANELLEVLCAYRTNAKSTTGETLFSLAMAMVPVEIGARSLRRENYNPKQNETLQK